MITERALTMAECVVWQGTVATDTREGGVNKHIDDVIGLMAEEHADPVQLGSFSRATKSALFHSSKFGETIFLRSETVALLSYAAQAFESGERTNLRAAPVDSATIFLEEALEVYSASTEQTYLMDAIGYFRAEVDGAFFAWYFPYVRAPGDARLTRETVRMGLALIEDDTPLNHEDIVNGEEPPSTGESLRNDEVFAFMEALWAMLDQPVMVSSRETPTGPNIRAARKRLAHGTGGSVRVLSLRRREGGAAAGGAHTVEWSHRWIVRGFWRNQRCGEKGASRKRIWVQPYVKGPSDKPLMVGAKVYKE